MLRALTACYSYCLISIFMFDDKRYFSALYMRLLLCMLQLRMQTSPIIYIITKSFVSFLKYGICLSVQPFHLPHV